MKRLIMCAMLALVALPVRAQDVKTVLDNRTKGYQQGLAQVESDAKKQEVAWQDQYLLALKTLEQKVTKGGDLDGVIQVRKEIERFRKARQVGEGDVVQEPAELASLQARAVKMPKSIESSRIKQVRVVTLQHIDGLDELKKRLTQQGQIEDALKINEEITRLKKELEVIAPQPEPSVIVAAPSVPVVMKTVTIAAPKQAKGKSPIGRWRTHPPDQPAIHLIMTLHEDGRFVVQDDQAWSGTFKFLDDAHTQIERTCGSGAVFTLEYNPETDEMMQSDGAPFVRDR